MAKRLLVDITKCDECEACTVQCTYMYQPGMDDHGLRELREQASYALVCRRCENPSCVAACRFDAVEKQADGVLKRYNMRCVSCKCCSQACPFGTIYPEVIPFYAARCDYCMTKLEKGDPACLSSCAKNAIEFKEVDEKEEGICVVNEHLAVRAPKWEKKAV